MRLHLRGRNGLGDAIYTRAIVKAALRAGHELWISTAWPELFSDLPIRYVRPVSGLRDPNRNVARYPDDFWETPPADAVSREIKYRWRELRAENLLAQMARRAGVWLDGLEFDLPPLQAVMNPSAPYAVVRPVTARTDWPNPARNPEPAYIAQAANILTASGYQIVSVAALEAETEVQLGRVQADVRLEHGELDPLRLMGLVRDAAVVVGGVGWVLPACLATGTPLVVVGGGRGGCDAPECLVDRRLDASRVRWLLPDRYCRCTSKRHACPKQIHDFPRRFRAQVEAVTLRRVA